VTHGHWVLNPDRSLLRGNDNEKGVNSPEAPEAIGWKPDEHMPQTASVTIDFLFSHTRLAI
jgi:hypothetical protein